MPDKDTSIICASVKYLTNIVVVVIFLDFDKCRNYGTQIVNNMVNLTTTSVDVKTLHWVGYQSDKENDSYQNG